MAADLTVKSEYEERLKWKRIRNKVYIMEKYNANHQVHRSVTYFGTTSGF